MTKARKSKLKHIVTQHPSKTTTLHQATATMWWLVTVRHPLIQVGTQDQAAAA
ncbi:hypothetical protein H8K36_08180 [Undibacterium sp. LX22W]|uniref:Uncharacterized protein n=2 Tax=Undibacterium TaxID=401469 RepID=A0A923HL23_9BURK|nr:hypothetical protein [Undibacterium nitidum]MBC3881344.1 hypothetical protein [Undibacterium nitidum]